ncbi:MAG: TadE/TadG family type IV pilus assembly protein [Armatimonadota bacterium]|jgi:hypothetical protein
MPIHDLPLLGHTVGRSFVSCGCRSRRRGTAYVLTVIALPMLLGVGALAIDLALMGLAAQRVQNVADTAALAGATHGADSAASAVAAGQTTGTNNAFSNWQVDATISTYGPGETVPGFRTLGYREHVTAVSGTTDFEFIFARVFGLERAPIRREAAAMSEVWRNRLAEGFVFAGSSDPGVCGIYSDGQGNRYNGSIHSNTGISLNGKDNVLTGDIRYRNSYQQNAPNFTHQGELIVTPVTEYPVDFAWADFDRGSWDHEVAGLSVTETGTTLPGGRWRVRGDMTVRAADFHCSDALFVVDGNIRIEGARKMLDGVTLVAQGSITVIGADGRFSPYLHDLFAFSAKASTSDVMSIDGSRCLASGVMFAPNGGLYWEGSAEESYHVGLIGNTVRLVGSFSTHDGPASALICDETSRAKLVL